ncbi:unannotated protein [freshwater metagenome]|uniref:Unannotated protein n=1 Tax=freshwater metagenome TaxID=449393 RepID=A0A6J6FLS7_9ZZZZ
MRQLSANDGASSSVSATSADTFIARRSQSPRIGSRRRIARTAKIMVGIMKMMNGARHPKAYARNPAEIGPRNAPTALAARCTEKTLERDSIG